MSSLGGGETGPHLIHGPDQVADVAWPVFKGCAEREERVTPLLSVAPVGCAIRPAAMDVVTVHAGDHLSPRRIAETWR